MLDDYLTERTAIQRARGPYFSFLPEQGIWLVLFTYCYDFFLYYQ